MMYALALALLQTSSEPPLAITRVTVIDGPSSLARAAQTVVIRGNRIVAVGAAAATPVPQNARVLSGDGKFLVPGLWDMHVHVDVPAGREVLALYVRNGVLSVRDLAGRWDQIRQWRADIARGALLGPRILASGPYLEGGDVPIPHILVRSPVDARRAVDSLARLGVDVVKLHGQMAPPVYFAAARAARERGMRVAGHVPRTISPAQASDSGVGSLEHLLQIPVRCTPAESLALAPRFRVQSVLGPCSSSDQAELFRTLRRNQTRVVPTLVAAYEIALWPTRSLPGDAYASFLPDTLRRFVLDLFQMPPDVPAGADSVGRAMFAKRLELVARLDRAGISLMTGTDAPLRNSPPGFGLHEELALFAEAGIPPASILRAATWEPARYFGMLDSLGTVAPGRIADLVLLEANPLADIRNTRRITAVVAAGRVVVP